MVFIILLATIGFNRYATYFSLSGLAVSLIFLVVYVMRRKRSYRDLDLFYQNALMRLERQKAANLEQQKILGIRIHYAGLFSDTLSKGIAEVARRYSVLKSYVDNLKIWQKEEIDKTPELTPESAPFVALLDNLSLDDYFNQHQEDIIRDLRLLDFLATYQVGEEGLLACKQEIRRKILDAIRKQCGSFRMCPYLIKTTSYPFVQKPQRIDDLFQKLTQWSRPCLHYAISNLETMQPKEYFVFMNMSGDLETNQGRGLLRHGFQQTPFVENISDPNKVLMLQKQNVKLEDLDFA
jgi:hypothetical protein